LYQHKALYQYKALSLDFLKENIQSHAWWPLYVVLLLFMLGHFLFFLRFASVQNSETYKSEEMDKDTKR
jgi:hypothetical protein